MDDEDIIECWSDGMTVREIANELGLSMLTVIKCLEKNGL
jgi:DNA-binding NarL/FixJ family response regulator